MEDSTHNMNQLRSLLNQLHLDGFYREVQIHTSSNYGQTHIDQIASVSGLKELSLSIRMSFTLPPIRSLRTLVLHNNVQLGNSENIAENLVNLERVQFRTGRFDFITPFLRRAPKLKEIRIKILENGEHFEDGIIDLAALNTERSALAGTKPVTIFVAENVFLSTKHAISETKYKFVELKRLQADDLKSK